MGGTVRIQWRICGGIRNADLRTLGSRNLIRNGMTGSVTVFVLFCFDGGARARAHSSGVHCSKVVFCRKRHFQHSLCIRMPTGLASSRPAPASTSTPSCIT